MCTNKQAHIYIYKQIHVRRKPTVAYKFLIELAPPKRKENKKTDFFFQFCLETRIGCEALLEKKVDLKVKLLSLHLLRHTLRTPDTLLSRASRSLFTTFICTKWTFGANSRRVFFSTVSPLLWCFFRISFCLSYYIDVNLIIVILENITVDTRYFQDSYPYYSNYYSL